MNNLTDTIVDMSRGWIEALTEPYKSYWLRAREQLSPTLSKDYRDSWTQATTDPDYEGSAERLSIILEACDRLSHKKLTSGKGTKYPPNLGFLNHVHRNNPKNINHLDKWSDCFIPKRIQEAMGAGTWYISQLPTERLCGDCFQLAVPRGFNTWSITYGEESNQVFCFPPQVKAGEEDFLDGGIVTDEEKYSPAFWNWSSAIPYPIPFEGLGPWRCIQHLGNPFYIDKLHSEPLWKPSAYFFNPIDPPDHPGRLEFREQGEKINEANFVAYLNAANVIVGFNDGGAGKNSTLEQRVAYDRLILEFSGRFHDTPRFQMPENHAERSRALTYDNTEVRPDDVKDHSKPSGGMPLTPDELEQLNELETAVDYYATPPGYPNFYKLVDSSRVTQELQANTSNIPNFAVPTETLFEQNRKQLETQRRDIWQCSESEWLQNRLKAVTSYNALLKVLYNRYEFFHSDLWKSTLNPLSLDDPCHLTSNMGQNTTSWFAWQKFKLDNTLRDHEIYPGYVGLDTMQEYEAARQRIGTDPAEAWREALRVNEVNNAKSEAFLREMGVLPGGRTTAQEEIEADERDPGPVGTLDLKVDRDDSWMDYL